MKKILLSTVGCLLAISIYSKNSHFESQGSPVSKNPEGVANSKSNPIKKSNKEESVLPDDFFTNPVYGLNPLTDLNPLRSFETYNTDTSNRDYLTGYEDILGGADLDAIRGDRQFQEERENAKIAFGIVLVCLIIFAITITIIYIRREVEENQDLSQVKVADRFSHIAMTLNELIYSGAGSIKEIDKRSFNLSYSRSNTILTFFYKQEHLTIIWKKNSLKRGEKVFEKQFNDVNNAGYLVQKIIAHEFFEEGEKFFASHGLSGIKSNRVFDIETSPFGSKIPDDGIVFGKEKIPSIIEIFSGHMIDEISFLNETQNPLKGSPLESMYVLDLINQFASKIKDMILDNPKAFSLNEDQINYIHKKVYNNIYEHFFDSEED